MRPILLMLAGLAAAAPAGCATADNLFGKEPCRVYGGTRTDADIIAQTTQHDSDAVQDPRMNRSVLAYACCCGMADLPLSFCADTLTLPVTLAASRMPAPAKEADRGEPARGEDK